MSDSWPLITAAEVLLGESPVGTVVYDGHTGDCVLANQAMADMIGGSVQGLRGQNFRDLDSWRESGLRDVVEQTLGDGVPRRHAAKLRTCRGELVTLDFSLSRFDAAGVPHLMVVVSDITEATSAEQALTVREDELRALVATLPDLVVRYDRDLRRVYVNPAWERASGLSSAEAVDVHAPSTPRVPVAAHAGYMRKLRKVLTDGVPQTEECTWVNARGERLFLEYVMVPEHDRTGQVTGILAVGHDLTARKRAEEQLVHRAHHDDLTGLPNRTLLLAHLEAALARSRRSGSCVGVLFLDLDEFKAINDSLGHTAGDEFLTKVADRISTSLRVGDLAARVGGDEFVVVCENLDDPAGASAVADRIQRTLATEFPLRGQLVTAPLSIGMAFSHDGSTPETLLRDADAAMYVAKKRGGRRCESADGSPRTAALRILTVEAELRHALERQELLVYYQPLVDLPTGRITSVEALLRWRRPRQGLVPPEEFVDVAEQRGLITEIGDWALHTACAQAATWYHRYGDSAPRLAVNISSQQLGGQGIVEQVQKALDAHTLPAHRLCLEITESQLLVVEDSAVRDLEDLAERGVRIAIDDFGTGRTGFDYLRRLPVSELKVDKSFIDGVATDSTHTAITTSIVALGLSLGLGVVAEGIETPQQLRALRVMGCPTGQGWLWHPALPGADLDAELQDHARPCPAGRTGPGIMIGAEDSDIV